MSDIKKISDTLYKEIEKELLAGSGSETAQNVGEVQRINDGVAVVSGLSEVMLGEIVSFIGKKINGVAINLSEKEVGVIILGEYSLIKEGDVVSATGETLSIKVSDTLFGRVVSPTMESVDGKGSLNFSKGNFKEMPIEKIAPGIIFREPVNTPLSTGIKAIDAVIPIGRGQRELIIGDKNTGKTSIAIDTIINQAKLSKEKGAKRVISVFVAIGQKQSRIAQMIDKLDSLGATDTAIFVVANASDPVALQYLAPYAGCAIAEYFMEQGEDVLIVYDDLTKHAWAYRQIALILKRPSGREAYPGDIFYLHSRLLERACKLSKKMGGGSITALPIVETQAQDISAYIPTNIISITDGQIYLENDLFYQGIRPAINVGLSVSRVGGAAQIKAMKQVAGKLKLDLAQFSELAAFAQFGSDMDSVTKSKIERGRRVVEVLKQSQFKPFSIAEEILEIWLVSKGYLDIIDISLCREKSTQFVKHVLTLIPDIKNKIVLPEGLTNEIEEKLIEMADSFFK